MADYTGKKTDKLCPSCKQGWLHDYPQDPKETLRCGQCGEPHTPSAAKPAAKREAK